MLRPILICGAARSGTSLVAGIFNRCGAWGGVMDGPQINNRRGMFENTSIRRNMVKPFLVSIGADKLGQRPLPDIARVHAVSAGIADDWRERVLAVLRAEGYTSGQWFYKCAKMCHMWPLWAAACPEARWIIVLRPDQDIIASCMRATFMRAYKSDHGWQYWLDEHKKRLRELYEAGLSTSIVWSDWVAAGDFWNIRHAIESCELTWDEEAVKEFVDPGLYHLRGEVLRA